ncbi:MAG: DUF1549 domain-containing protein [Verrucomicrobiota bacterium]
MMTCATPKPHTLSALLSACLVLGGTPLLRAVDYEQDIAPIFEANCIDCHGPDKDKAGFRVDSRAIMIEGGDSGLASIVPGDWEKSFLMEVVTHLDEDMAMPPKGDKLPDEDIALLEQWVNEGAVWPGQMDATVDKTVKHWSFLPVERPEVPSGVDHPVDAFLDAKLEEKGLEPNAEADPLSLARRASIVLTGLPPTPEQVTAFEAEFAKDPDAAYNALVEELLASPHFGERWAQHWLDVIRWAETNGSESNLYRKNAWIYRDYVVRAFNEDLPYDQFLKEQLAGDQLGVGEATGFLVAGPHVPAATVGQEPSAIRQARADRMDEVMQTVGASVLGVTVSCARCHDHKFDPISIQDYYSMTAVFQGVEFGGRWPEFAEEHPRRERADELYAAAAQERNILREGMGSWEENWGGFTEMVFPATKTKALRIDFDRPFIGVDELQVYGPEERNRNLALSSAGTELETDDSMTQVRGELYKANDGEFGTQ